MFTTRKALPFKVEVM